jgi:hypothetical protein
MILKQAIAIKGSQLDCIGLVNWHRAIDTVDWTWNTKRTLYAGLEYLFANPLTLIAASMAEFGVLLAATIGIPLACFVVWRIGIMAQMLRHLRLRRITPLIVNVKITGGESIAILDLVRPMRGRRFYAPV